MVVNKNLDRLSRAIENLAQFVGLDSLDTDKQTIEKSPPQRGIVHAEMLTMLNLVSERIVSLEKQLWPEKKPDSTAKPKKKELRKSTTKKMLTGDSDGDFDSKAESAATPTRRALRKSTTKKKLAGDSDGDFDSKAESAATPAKRELRKSTTKKKLR